MVLLAVLDGTFFSRSETCKALRKPGSFTLRSDSKLGNFRGGHSQSHCYLGSCAERSIKT